jgi:hypothetical protein
VRLGVSHTVPVSDSGFVDEAPSGASPGASEPSGAGRSRRSRRSRRGRRPATIAFGVVVVLVVGLVAFGGWAWSSRVHADDLAAYESLAREIDVLDRSMVPLGHSELPPCREGVDGRITRTYPASTGPQAAQLVGYLEQSGWTPGPAAPPTFAHLTRTESGHELSIDVAAATESSLVESLTATSPAGRLGCVGR